MFLPNQRVLTFGVLLVGLLLPAIPTHGQDLGWARQFSGTQSIVAYDAATDAAGNIYATGYFEGVIDFDPGAGVSNLTASGGDDAFVVKLDSAGSLIWARRLGGANDQGGWSIAVDSNGNVYTTGSLESTADFDPGAGSFPLSAVGDYSAFVSKLDSNGNFVWAKLLGTSGYSSGEGIAVDGAGNVYSVGYFNGTGDFDPGAGVSTVTSPGLEDAYVSKLDSAGNLLWVRHVGGTNYTFAYGVALDANNNVHVIGGFDGTADFNPGSGTANLTTAGDNDVFIFKLDSSGNYLWSRRFGSGSGDIPYGIAIDANGNVHTTGYFLGTVDFNPGLDISNLSSVGSMEDIFISKLDASGNLVWARRMGGSGFDFGYDIAIGGDGSVYTTGLFGGTADFDPGAGASNLTAAGGDEIFVSKLDSAGNFTWARAMGGSGDEYGAGIALRGSNVYVTGRFEGTADMDPSGSVLNLTSKGERDAFIVNLTAGTGGATPVISSGGIVMANLLPKVATVSPLSIISIFGQNFSSETILYPNLAGQGQLATSLGGACVMMNGTALPIFAVTPTQINAQVSANKAFGPASVTVVTNCGTANALSSAPLLLEGPAPREATSGVETVTVEAATPSFFVFSPVAANGFIAARFNTGSAAVATAGLLNDQFGPSRPAKPGEIILLYGTGWGETSPSFTTGQLATGAAEVLPSANAKITLGGIQLAAEDVLYVGVTPQTAGLYQAAIRIPANATPGNKQVVLTVYGKSTPVGPVIAIGAP